MTRAQGIAMLDAMASVKMSGQLVLRYAQDDTPTYQVQMDPSRTYTGTELNMIADYCAAQGLQLSAMFEQMGVV